MSQDRSKVTKITEKNADVKAFHELSDREQLNLTMKSLVNFNDELASLGKSGRVRVSSLSTLNSKGAVAIKKDDDESSNTNILDFKP